MDNQKKDEIRKRRMLTWAELRLMSILWSLPGMKGTVSDMLERYEGRKPAYTTVATVVHTLIVKGYVAFDKLKGTKKLCYYPLMTREEYAAKLFSILKDDLFGGSYSALVCFCVREGRVPQQDLKEMLRALECGSGAGSE